MGLRQPAAFRAGSGGKRRWCGGGSELLGLAVGARAGKPQEPHNADASPSPARNGASTVVTAIFGGILQNEVNCLICGTESRKFDPFLGTASLTLYS